MGNIPPLEVKNDARDCDRHVGQRILRNSLRSDASCDENVV